jgi:hypothetical protein
MKLKKRIKKYWKIGMPLIKQSYTSTKAGIKKGYPKLVAHGERINKNSNEYWNKSIRDLRKFRPGKIKF